MAPPDAPDLDVRALLRSAHAPRVGLPGQRVFARAFVPAFLLFTLLPWYSPAPSATALAARTSFVLLLSMVLIWCAEQLYPVRREWNARGGSGWRALLRDFIYLFGVTQLTALLVRAVEPHLSWLCREAGLRPLWPTGAPLTLKVALAFLLMELSSYWIHRAAHRFTPLWQFHSTHHVIAELNGLKSVRTHPVDNLVFYMCRTAPLLLLGAGTEELVAATYFGGVLGILSHANIQVRHPWLGWVLNLPDCHVLHHSAEVEESQSNFGCHTVLWDRVFRTYRAPREGPLTLGVHPLGARTLWQELAWPLYRSVSAPPRS